MKFLEIPGLGQALGSMKECSTEIMSYELYKYPKASSCEFNEFRSNGISFHLYKRWGRDDREYVQEVIMPYARLAPYADDEELYGEPYFHYSGPTEEMKAAKIAHEEAEKEKLAHTIAEQNKKLRQEEYSRFLAMKAEVDRLAIKFEGK